MTSVRQTFVSGMKPIAVDAIPPSSPGQFPAVLMLHGADGLNASTRYEEGASAIAEAGYRVYLVHYLDRTGERRAFFPTLFQNFEIWMETVRDAVSWVAEQPGVDPERIGIVGISLGAALGLAVAGTDRRIKALVDYFGPLPQGAIAADAHLPPTLVLHGLLDAIVPAANAYAIEALLKERAVPYEIKIYPSQAHGFRGEAHADAARRVKLFLHRHLAGASADAPPLPAAGQDR